MRKGGRDFLERIKIGCSLRPFSSDSSGLSDSLVVRMGACNSTGCGCEKSEDSVNTQ